MHCLDCLKELEKEAYCSRCIKYLWNGNKNIQPLLVFDRNKLITIRRNIIERMSISGIQDKISLRMINNQLIQTDKNGEYILKPIPSMDVPKYKDDIPANEHLTMQAAKQIFNINTAENSLIRFSDGELAYITKRFDRQNNRKLQQEDFCQLSNRTEDTHGKNYKYDGTCEEVGNILKKYCSAYKIEIEKLFFIILFNYIFGNGDAHLKNFSLIKSIYGDYLLSPAYDLLATSIHFPDESRTALELFNDFETESFRQNGFYKQDDFLELALIYGINKSRAEKYITIFKEKQIDILALIQCSFLTNNAKESYTHLVKDRLKALAD